MTTTTMYNFIDFLNPARLFGPIFDKELRVSSRRKRNYFLRSGYIVLLSIFILFVWYTTIGIHSSGTNLYQVSRFSQFGRSVIVSFVWFQFFAAQLIAIIMLSSSISDEMHSGTLNVLMTTPVNSIQIVIGKLLSKLLQLMLVLAISLPFLTIFRIFGGVPWDYIVSSVCITLTAVFFAGALSLFLSIYYRYSYSVILVVVIGYMLFLGALPGFFVWLGAKGVLDQNTVHSIIALINPFWAMAAVTQKLSTPSIKIFSWPIHCLVMSVAAVFLLALSVLKIRHAALSESFAGRGKLRSKNKNGADASQSQIVTGPVRRVAGSPIFWKEMYKGFFGRGRTDTVITFLLFGLYFLAAILFLFSARNNDIMVFPYYIISGVYLIVMIRLAIFTAGSIAGEKEARTWPVLLMTPLKDMDIILGKVLAAIWRNIPLLVTHMVLLGIFYCCINSQRFSRAQISISLLIAAASIIGSVLFLIGSGLYFSTRFRTAAFAIAATICSYLVVRYLFCGIFNPFRYMLMRTIMRSRTSYLILSFAVSIVPTIVLSGIGIILTWRAICRLRRDVF
jgi:ABC-type transport system involved in multi-copper enzyme maturation permease subunit